MEELSDSNEAEDFPKGIRFGFPKELASEAQNFIFLINIYVF